MQCIWLFSKIPSSDYNLSISTSAVAVKTTRLQAIAVLAAVLETLNRIPKLFPFTTGFNHRYKSRPNVPNYWRDWIYANSVSTQIA